MSLRAQIHNNLNSKETKELLEIWQNGDISVWEDEVFEIVKEILLTRLGYIPPQSVEIQFSRIIKNAEKYLENGELDKALSACELAIQMKPDSAIAYNCRGEIYDELGQIENAITSYKIATQIDPKLNDAWENLLSAEKDLEQDDENFESIGQSTEEFENSTSKQHLDLALEYFYDDEQEKAFEEYELAISNMPNNAAAYNYLGMILEELEQLEPAADAYLKAIQINYRFYAARENLANARVRLEENLYRQIAKMDIQSDEQIENGIGPEFYEFGVPEISENDGLLPQWLYLDEKAFLLPGWAGHRTRQGRSGYDPLDADFENARMQGVIIHKLFIGKFRTRNPIYLLFMTFVGLIYCSPLLAVISLLQNIRGAFLIALVYSPYLVPGIALLFNVVLSLLPGNSDEADRNGAAFF